MSDLQLTFILIGILLFVGISAYSWSKANPKGVNKLRSPRSRNRGSRRPQRDFDAADEYHDDQSFGYHSEQELKLDSQDNVSKVDNSKPKERQIKGSRKAKKAQRKSQDSGSAIDETLGLKELDVEPNLMIRVAAKRGMAAKLRELTKKPIRAALEITRNGSKSAQPAKRKSVATDFRNSSPSVKDESVVSTTKLSSQFAAGQSSVSVNEPIEKPDGADTKAGITTDLVARISIKRPLEQQELMVLLREYDYKFHRAVHLYGLNQLTDIWCDVEHEQPSAQFVDLGLSIQLADRNGAMSSKEAHDFQQMVLAFTTRFDAPFEFSIDIDDALNQALKLDKIGIRFDSMAVLNIVPKSREGFRVADVESCARDLVMLPDANGVFMKTTGQRNDLSVMYRLACSDGEGNHGLKQVNGGHVFDLVLIMNVPATSNPEQVFQEMIDDANKLAVWLEGKVVDRHGGPLTQRSLNALLKQVSEISSGLRALGVLPGDSVSKKLF